MSLIKRQKGGACRWDLQSQLYVFLGFTIRKIITEQDIGLKIQRI
jgi:hypothetical protein